MNGTRAPLSAQTVLTDLTLLTRAAGELPFILAGRYVRAAVRAGLSRQVVATAVARCLDAGQADGEIEDVMPVQAPDYVALAFLADGDVLSEQRMNWFGPHVARPSLSLARQAGRTQQDVFLTAYLELPPRAAILLVDMLLGRPTDAQVRSEVRELVGQVLKLDSEELRREALGLDADAVPDDHSGSIQDLRDIGLLALAALALEGRTASLVSEALTAYVEDHKTEGWDTFPSVAWMILVEHALRSGLLSRGSLEQVPSFALLPPRDSR